MCTIPIVEMGYHEYKDVWSDPLDGTELSCESKPGIPRHIGCSGCWTKSNWWAGCWPLSSTIFSYCLIFIHQGTFSVHSYWTMAVFHGFWEWKFHVVIFSKQITRQKVIKHGNYLRLYLKSQLNEYQRMKQHNWKHKSRAGSWHFNIKRGIYCDHTDVWRFSWY